MAAFGELISQLAPTIAPAPDQNRADAMGQRTGKELARRVAEQHRQNLQATRFQRLTWEKYLLHIDGEGDNMYADILYGTRVAIPRQVTAYREQENLLRLIADNAVAYHTTMPFRFVAEGGFDRRSREKVRFDTAFANYVSRTQRLNSVFGQAFYMSIPAGFCPVHAWWRDDLNSDPYEPLYYAPDEMNALMERGIQPPRRGIIDAWVGNPFDTSFSSGTKRDSVQAMWYGRVLPADMVRDAFEDILAQQNVRLEGTDQQPSASAFQDIARRWQMTDLNAHGTASMQRRPGKGEELVALVHREIPPGVDRQYPDGRLTIVALQGETATDRMSTGHSAEAILLADQDLPAKRFSAELVYSHHRFDDVHGKPWIADADNANVALNILLSKEREYIERSINAPTIVGGPMVEDSMEYDGYTILELEHGVTMPPRTMELPASPARMLKNGIEDLREYIFRVGGYQAASRGEGMAGDSAAKVVALARNDDTIHGPINVVFRDSVQRFMGLCWSLMKEYGDVGWVVDALGEDSAYLADSYVDRTKLSDKEPNFRLVSGYGATPETQGQQLMGMVTARGADGEPLMSTAEFRRRWPDQSLYADDLSPKASQKRRALQVAEAIRRMAQAYREQTGFQGTTITDPWVQKAGYDVFMQIEQQFVRLRDDDPDQHIAALGEVTQDETEDPIARQAAILRQNVYYQWKAMMMAPAPMPGQAPQGGGPAPGPSPPTGKPNVVAPGNRPDASPANAANPRAMRSEVRALTRTAKHA